MGTNSSAFLIFTMFLVAELVICFSEEEADANFGCILREMNALLRFKASFSDPSGRLSSWNTSTDCCKWQGIKCDETSHHVIGLDLQNQRYGDIYSHYMLRSETLDSSILDLKHLSFLDLSGNDFHLTSIPTFLGSMSQMQHLNFSYANFSGVVPHHIGNLSLLSVLDLSYNGVHQLIVDDFSWVSHLPLLSHVNMSQVNLSRTNNCLNILNMLPFVVDLCMSRCELENRNLQQECVNSTNRHIENLDLSDNMFHGELPCFLENMTSLLYLNLSSNFYNSWNHPHLAKLTNLARLDLGYNSLQCNVDSISKSISDKPHLKYLSLANNSCNGDVSKIFLTLLGHHKFEFLDLSSNHFCGQLPEEIGGIRKLHTLDLRHNNVSGSIPTTVGNLSSLKKLFLSDNQLSGEIPTSLGQHSNLVVLYLNQNNLNGTITESHFAMHSKLRSLAIRSNPVNFGVRSNWIPPFQLQLLGTHSCEIVGGEFPEWIQMQKDLQSLYIPNCSISGPLPNWLLYRNILHVDLSQNSFSGEISDSICQLKHLELLDLSENSLSGDLPECWAMLNMLRFLSLTSNRLSGVIPESIGGAYSLEWLQLNNNSFTGELPCNLRNCTRLVVLDVGKNSISGKLPKWIGDHLPNLRALQLSNNMLYDRIPSNLCQLSKLQILDLGNNMLTENISHCIGNLSSMSLHISDNLLARNASQSILQLMVNGVEVEYFATLKYVVHMDLSNNNLVGEIPVELTNLVELLTLNLSRNYLQGSIPEQIGDMNSLESLDLSNNNLSRNIPRRLSDLNFLNHLNLSYNNLTGEIRTGYQLQTLEDISIYEGNPGLCGARLPKKCH